VDERLVTIARFNNPVEAHLVRTKLESEGIDCAVIDEIRGSTGWQYAIAIGGVRLQVNESDAQRALEILQGFQDEPIGDEPAEEQIAESETESDRCCPRCGAAEIQYEEFSRRLVFISLVFLGFPLPFLKRRWTCRNCGYQWKAR